MDAVIIVIPAFNEERRIGGVLDSLNSKDSLGIIRLLRIIVINDGSTDRTSGIAQSKGALVIDLNKNMGKGYALKAGMKTASRLMRQLSTQGWIVTMDADGQHSPEDIPIVIQESIKKRVLVMIANRSIRKPFASPLPVFRYKINYITTKFIRTVFGLPIHDLNSGFRAYSSSIAEFLLHGSRTNRFQFETEVLLECWAKNIRIGETPVSEIYFPGSPSRIRNFRDTILWIILVFARILLVGIKYRQRRQMRANRIRAY